MSDLAKRVADTVRRDGLSSAKAVPSAAEADRALAAFIEAAQKCRFGLNMTSVTCRDAHGEFYAICNECKQRFPQHKPDCSLDAAVHAYDAALRDLAQSMEVE